MTNKYNEKLLILGLAASVLGITCNIESASAQVAYGSYFGVGTTMGLTEDSQVGGVIAARYKFLKNPISLRTQALIGDSTAIVSAISYDMPLNWQTDVYLGVALVLASEDKSSTVGNKISFALQPGIDYIIPNSNTVIFGNAIIAFDSYRNRNSNAFSIQGGVSWRF